MPDLAAPDLEFLISTARQTSELILTCEFEVASIGCGDQQQVVLFLPSWTPGSYLIREFSRHLAEVGAEDAASGERLPCTKSSKNRFAIRFPASTRRLRVRYRVYAHELTVRTADLTEEHAFWNHACVLLWPVGGESLSARITIELPEEWDLACALPTTSSAGSAAPGTRRIGLRAEDMAHAYDSPCLLGHLQRHRWIHEGVEHEVVFEGLGPVPVPERMLTDLQQVVAAAAAVFGGKVPYRRYTFLCLFTADGHGGLEHCDSTVLLAARTALHGERTYREFLGLAAHELFHAWNVKRMRPIEFWRYDYEHENYTRLLWLLEGWTAYYDDLLCLRAGLMTRSDYLGVLAKSIQAVLNNPGRFRLSLAESSFDAWIRLYRPDENTRNSSQNYYGNGSIAALCMDLAVRSATKGERSLDDVLRHLFSTTYGQARGLTEGDVWAAFASIGGEPTAELARRLVEQPFDPDLAGLLAPFAIKIERREADRPYLGLQFESGQTTVASVTAHTPAHAAGLQPGDELLAIHRLRVDGSRWQDVFQAVARVDQPLEVLFARRGMVLTKSVVPAKSPGSVALVVDEKGAPEALVMRDGWIPQGSSAVGRSAVERT